MDDDDLDGGPANPEVDEFAAAFAQRAAELRSKGAPAQPPKDDAAKQQQAADGDGVGDDADQAAQQAAKPPAQAASDKQSADAGQPAQQQPAAAKPGRTVEELERELGLALHRERSVANRISANDRRVNELTAENAALKRKVAELERSAAKPTTTSPAGSSADDALASAPELEAAVKRRIDEATASLQQALDAANAKLTELGESTSKTAEAIRPVVERDADAAVNKVQSELDGMFTPQWRQDRLSVDFQRWLSSQSRAIQDLYADSVDAKDCAAVLDLYYAPRGGRPKPPPSPAPAPAAQGAQQPADRLKQAAGIRPGATPKAPVPDPNDYDAAFAEAAAARRNRKD